MIFVGVGKVNYKGKQIANFVNGTFETNNEFVIGRLKMLGFKEKGIDYICDICGYISSTPAGIASHKRFNHKEQQ
jgi:hypothetical protein